MNCSIFNVPGAVPVAQLVTEADVVKWIIHGSLPGGSTIIVAASPKTGKSLMVMQMGVAVARGEEFLGRPTAKHHVVYVALEDGRRRVARRFRQLGLTEADDLEFVVLFDATQIEALLDMVEESPFPLLVIIDPLIVLENQLGVKDENVALDIEKLFARLRRAAQASGSTIVLVHHFRKAGDTMRGSVALEGSSDGWWLLSRSKRSSVVRIDVTLRDAEDCQTAFEFLVDGDRISFVHRELAAAFDDDEATRAQDQKIVSFLREHQPETFSQRDLAEALGLSKAVVQETLASLEKAGQVTRPGGKRGGYTVPAEVSPELYD